MVVFSKSMERFEPYLEDLAKKDVETTQLEDLVYND
jgi:hypothetical protein